jgi:Holliday junction resolvasome RuvABC endonuclease subunit
MVVRRRRRTVQRADPYVVTNGDTTYVDGRGLDRRDVTGWLGVDQSLTNFGLALVTDGGYFLWRYSPKLPGDGTGQAERLWKIDQWLTRTLKQIELRGAGVAGVAMEQYAFAAKHRGMALGELGGVVKLALLRNFGISGPIGYPTICTPQKIKTYATGHHDASKAEVVAGVLDRWGALAPDDNCADAYTLARIARAFDRGADDYPGCEKVLDELATQRHTEWTPPSMKT